MLVLGERRGLVVVAHDACPSTLGAVISLDGAALIATVYPVGVLILVFEMRSVLAWMAHGLRRWPYLRAIVGVVLLAVVSAALGASVLCIGAVSSAVPLRGDLATYVTTAGYALYFAVCAGVGVSLPRVFLTDGAQTRN